MLISATAGQLRLNWLHFAPVMIITIKGTATVQRNLVKAISDEYPTYQVFQYNPAWAFMRPMLIHGKVWHHTTDESVLQIAIVPDKECPKSDWLRPRVHWLRGMNHWNKSQMLLFNKLYLFTRAMFYTLTYTDY